jgi:thiol-disulfide isomerase/thioredoxin
MTPTPLRRLAPPILLSSALLLAALLARAQSPAPAQKNLAPATQRSLEVLDADHYVAKVAAERGKPLMVTFWATWCEPCRDEFPMVNDLVRRYQPKGLAVFGMSLDDDAEESLALRFLAKTQPVFPNYRKKPGKEEEFINRVNPKWSGVLPATFFYDPEGRLIGELTGEQTRRSFVSAIEKTLATAPPK